MKSQSKAQSQYREKQLCLVDILKAEFKDTVKFGEEFIEDFKNINPYYLFHGVDVANNTTRAKVIGFLPVTDSAYFYYRTGQTSDNQCYTAVWLEKARYGWINDNLDPQILSAIQSMPYMVFFQGCDDGSWFKFFHTEQEALAFLEQFRTLDEVLNHCDGNAIYSFLKKDKTYVMTQNDIKTVVDNMLFAFN